MNRYAAANQIQNRSSPFCHRPHRWTQLWLYCKTEEAAFCFRTSRNSPACPIIWTVVGQPPPAMVTTPWSAVLDYFARARRAPSESRSKQPGRSANEKPTLFTQHTVIVGQTFANRHSKRSPSPSTSAKINK